MRVFREHQIRWTDEEISRLWNYYSKTSPYKDIYFSKVAGRQILQKSQLPLRRPLRVLDFGCGPGFMWEHLKSQNAKWQYTGVDFSPESIKSLIEKAQNDHHFEGAKHVTDLPTDLRNEAFDVVFLIEVVEHLRESDLEAIFREARRVIKMNGLLVVTTPNKEDLSAVTRFCPECGAIFHQWQHVRSWSKESLAEMVSQFGFVPKISRTLDLTAGSILRKAARSAARAICRTGKPHLLVVFRKV